MEYNSIRMNENTKIKEISDYGNLGEIKMICMFRYISVALTSAFYMVCETEVPIAFRLGVVASILLAAKIITELYIKYKTNKAFVKMLVLTETLGIALVLFSTSGIESPFIWYALNPVLVAASFLPGYFCWLNLFVCVVSSFSISYICFNYFNVALSTMLRENSYTILVLILVTLAVQMLASLIKRQNVQAQELHKERTALFNTNMMLEQAQASLENSMNHIMSLYQVIEAFTGQDSIEGFTRAFANYAAELTESSFSFFWMPESNDSIEMISFHVNEQESYKGLTDEIMEKVKPFFQNSVKSLPPTIITIANYKVMVIAVKSQARVFGLMGIEIEDKMPKNTYIKYEQQLTFLSNLSGIILERFHLEEVANNIALTEEQNRIANEIHDSVSQKMFSIACATHALKTNWQGMPSEAIVRQLELINVSSNAAMRELRSVIYGLSSKKKNESHYILRIKKYMSEFSKLNGISLDLNIKGDEYGLSGDAKKALFRIICEASGNSVRHGECTSLSVDLQIKAVVTELTIADNGKGFDFEDISVNYGGLGLYNMLKLVESLRGKFSITSNIGSGTKILITVPNKVYQTEEEGIAI